MTKRRGVLRLVQAYTKTEANNIRRQINYIKKKGSKMKTTNKANNWLLGIGVALAIAAVTFLPASSAAQEKGAQKLMQLKPIKTTQDIEALQAGDAVVMSCPKCKTITVTYVETIKGHIKEEKAKTEHLCPGCQTKIETKGVGRAAKNEVTHVCKKCGSKDVMCCVLKKGSGLTKGMDEEKK